MTSDADARFWDNIAESYALKPFPNPDVTAAKLAIVRGLLGPTDRLLDVGCGTGTIPLELAPNVAEAHGVDISAAMVAIADRKAAAAGVSNVVFHARPAGDLDGFADASFACVNAFNIFHLVRDPTALARAAYRVLRPGGVLVSSTACLGGTWFPPYALFLPILRWLGKAPPVTIFTRAELEAALRDAGFTDLQAPEVGAKPPTLFLTARKPEDGAAARPG